MSQTRRKNSSKKRRNSSVNRKDFTFIECPIAGLINFKSGKIKNGMYMFDSIDFFATDTNQECFEIEGLRFDHEKGWYDVNETFPKYYGKDVYEACIDYAVDRAIKDNLYLGIAIFGKKRPAEFVLMLNRSEFVSRLEDKGVAVYSK